MPDTDICLVVMPSEATQKSQAIHLQHLKALGMSCCSLDYTDLLVYQILSHSEVAYYQCNASSLLNVHFLAAWR